MGKSTRNLWSHFAPLGVEPEEVFMALRWLTGGTAKPEGARTVVGHPGRFLVGTTNRGRPKIEPLAPMSESQVDDLVRKCADLLADPRAGPPSQFSVSSRPTWQRRDATVFKSERSTTSTFRR